MLFIFSRHWAMLEHSLPPLALSLTDTSEASPLVASDEELDQREHWGGTAAWPPERPHKVASIAVHSMYIMVVRSVVIMCSSTRWWLVDCHAIISYISRGSVTSRRIRTAVNGSHGRHTMAKPPPPSLKAHKGLAHWHRHSAPPAQSSANCLWARLAFWKPLRCRLPCCAAPLPPVCSSFLFLHTCRAAGTWLSTYPRCLALTSCWVHCSTCPLGGG